MADLLASAKGYIAKATTGKPQIVELKGYLQPFEYVRRVLIWQKS